MKHNRLPTTITRNEMAAMLSISPQRVSQLTAAGVLKRSPDGGYVVAGSAGAYAEFRAQAVAKRQHPELDRSRQLELERLEARLRREERGLITMAETIETGEAIVTKFVEAYRSIPGRLEEGTALRQGLESAMPGYVSELEKHLRQPIKAMKAG